MLSLKDFKSFEVNNKSFVGGVTGKTRGDSGDDFIGADGNMYHGATDGGSLSGCPCAGGSSGSGTTSYSLDCC